MIYKTFRPLIFRPNRFVRFRCRYFHKTTTVLCKLVASELSPPPSYLYVGRSKLPFTLEPDLDFRQDFERLPRLKSILKNRKIDNFVDLDALSKRYAEIWPRFRRRRRLAEEINELSEELKSVDDKTKSSARPLLDDDEAKADIRRKIFDLKNELKSIEYEEDWDRIFVQCLNLPNGLDQDTPIDSDHMISAGSTPCAPLCDHADFLQRRNYIRFKADPDRLYLTDAAADAYRFIDQFCRSYFDRSDYRLVSPSHFAKSSIIEAHDSRRYFSSPDSSFAVDVDAENSSSIWALNLVGRNVTSLLSLFVERCFSAKNEFPLIFYTTGTTYKPNIRASSTFGSPLFTHFQRPMATVFILARSGEELSDVIEKRLSTDVDKIVDLLKLGARPTCYNVAASNLRVSESKRTDWRWKFSENREIPLATLSKYDEYLSKRIRSLYKSGVTKKGHPAPVDLYLHSASLELDLYVLLAAVIERYFETSKSGNDETVLKNLESDLLKA